MKRCKYFFFFIVIGISPGLACMNNPDGDEKWYEPNVLLPFYDAKSEEKLYKGEHVLDAILKLTIDIEHKKRLLTRCIAYGANPNNKEKNSFIFHYDINGLSYRLLCNDIFLNNSLYKKAQCLGLEQFMRKERGWYLMRPLLLAVYIYEMKDEHGNAMVWFKQPAECAMRILPKEIIFEIGKYILNWKIDGTTDRN